MIKVLSVADEPTFVLDTKFYEPINIEWKSPSQDYVYRKIWASDYQFSYFFIGTEDRLLESMVVRGYDVRTLELSEPADIRRDSGAPIIDIAGIKLPEPTDSSTHGTTDEIYYFVAVGKRNLWVEFDFPGEIAWAVEGKITTFYMTAEGFLKRIKVSLTPEQMAEWRHSILNMVRHDLLEQP